ncbi:glycosyltransferase family 4 protein [Baaleninema sp.]|uniref:glycosyltransferase family 4 protein n=1 Tax=Baaleninema sp. TaxID=3101197 RepID=UPI003D082302
MKIAYVTMYDVLDRESWPKTQLGMCQAGYSIAQNLANLGCAIEYVGGLQKKRSIVTKLKWEFYRRSQNRDYYRWAEPAIVKDFAQQIDRQLQSLDFDVILCGENSLPLADLEVSKPLVLWTDAPLSALINYYPYLSNICQETRDNIYTFEKRALDRCQTVIYASKWAAQNAIETYNLPESKVRVVPWGANWDVPTTRQEIELEISRRSSQSCKLLFLGVEWNRKGGDIALNVTRELNRMGLPTTLTIAGGPPTSQLPEFAKYVGYLKKNTKYGRDTLQILLETSHFLILPTQAESYGMVFCEAHQFGLPCLTTNVGGVPSIVQHGVTGFTLPKDADISHYCDAIFKTFNDSSGYYKMAIAAFDRYEKLLNWQSACQTVKGILKNLI